MEEGVAVSEQLGVDTFETPHVEHVQVELTVPSLQMTFPLLPQALEIPPCEEQQPGQAA